MDAPRKTVVEVVNRRRRLAITDEDVRLPITKFLDADGEECEPDEAVTAIAGTDDFGWVAIDLKDFTGLWS